MKKTNFLKFALTLVMAFVMTGAWAQTYPAAINTDYVQVTENTFQTVNLDLTLYAAPDPNYSPSYVAATNAGYNAGSLWTWDIGTLTAPAPFVNNTTAIAFNTVVINGTATAGDYVVSVAEQFGAAGCADGSPVFHTITFIDEPDATMVGANTGALWSVTTIGTEFYRCGDTYVDDLTLTFTEDATGYEGFAYDVTVTAIRYNADGDPVDGAGVVIADPADATDVTATFGVETVADITAIAVADFEASPVTVTIPADMTFLQVGGVDVRTKYVFTLSGVASRISSLSHAREGAANAYYAPTVAQTVTYWLNLPPVTGPIYHIPNTFNF